jgi:UDP-N-acetylmuramate: L-alanyl-gamma-D-glutamyl-meso-diaminopimelate ligase
MHIHILGICGTFMGGLAALAIEAGHKVSGCDAGVYPPMSDQLASLGIHLTEGYGADQMALKPDVFVIGNVVSRVKLADGSPRYPLMEAIMDSGAAYTSGPQWLSEHILHKSPTEGGRKRHVMAVAGTHGKTTTTSMLAWILEATGHAPGYLVGGVPLNFGTSARLGQGPCFVIEADEYDTAFFDKRSKFVHYRPRTAVLNNLEFDHADIFDDLAAIERQFHHLLRTVPSSGQVVYNAEQDSIQRVLALGRYCEAISFGENGRWQAIGEPHQFDITDSGTKVAQVQWKLQGVHNQMNALAAIAAAAGVGVAPQAAAQALAQFQNVRRRMEVRGIVPGKAITVYDDFAHHPSAIATTLDGLRRQVGPKARILAVFEPRSNTMKLGAMKDALAGSLVASDLVFCHAAGLDWDPALPLAPLGDRAMVSRDLDAIVEAVRTAAKPGDHILCMSNGGFGGIHARLLAALA